MPSGRDTLRRRLFADGVQALHTAAVALGSTSPTGQLYPCPQCVRGFAPTSLDEPGVLTVEDSPPLNIPDLGGRLKLLTCGECNHTAGTLLDAELHRREQVERIGRRERDDVRGMITIDGMRFPATMDTTDEVGFTVHADRADPETVARMREMLESGSIHATGSFTAQDRWSRQRVRVGLLRHGYLAAFAKFGWLYVLQRHMAQIREQIADPETEVLPRGFIRTLDDELADRVGRLALLVLRKPFALGAVIGNDVVVLPHPFAQSLNIYAELAADPDGPMKFEGDVFEWPRHPLYELDHAGRREAPLATE